MCVGGIMVGIIIGLLIAFVIIGIKQDNNPNTSQKGFSKWKDGTYCKECAQVYDKSGLSPSIYTCPRCGNKTYHCAFRTTPDGPEINSRGY